jgi:hypothetical protein
VLQQRTLFGIPIQLPYQDQPPFNINTQQERIALVLEHSLVCNLLYIQAVIIHVVVHLQIYRQVPFQPVQQMVQLLSTLVAGQKYYILIDGYGGNECNYEFQIYNGTTCCTADLGATEGTDRVLCFGEDVTYGVTANPINFGTEAQSNPVIGWQFSTTQPTVINPFNPANTGKPYYVGQIDITTPGTTINDVYRDMQGNYPSSAAVFDGAQAQYPVIISGFPCWCYFQYGNRYHYTLC